MRVISLWSHVDLCCLGPTWPPAPHLLASVERAWALGLGQCSDLVYSICHVTSGGSVPQSPFSALVRYRSCLASLYPFSKESGDRMCVTGICIHALAYRWWSVNADCLCFAFLFPRSQSSDPEACYHPFTPEASTWLAVCCLSSHCPYSCANAVLVLCVLQAATVLLQSVRWLCAAWAALSLAFVVPSKVP